SEIFKQRSPQRSRNPVIMGCLEQWRQSQFLLRELRHDFLDEPRDQRVLAPGGYLRQGRQRGARLAPLPHAFEGLVVAVLEQRVEARRLFGLVEKVASEDAHQAWLGHEWRQGEEDETALGA